MPWVPLYLHDVSFLYYSLIENIAQIAQDFVFTLSRRNEA